MDHTPDAEPAGSGTATYTFGETHEDTITTTVRRADPFEITTSPVAAPTPSSPAWAVEFTFTNHSEKVFNPMFLRIGATVDGRAAQEVMDGTAGFNGLITTPPIAPGATVKVPVAYTGQGQQHTITVASLDGSKSAVFTD